MTITVYAKGLSVAVFDNVGTTGSTGATGATGATGSTLSTGSTGATSAPPTSLATLASNTVRDLGSYITGPVAFTGSRSDDSGIVCSGGKTYFFGGGHGGCNATDFLVMDQTNGGWVSQYMPMPYASMLLADMDQDHGRWKSNNHPYQRHTYHGQVIVGGRLYVFSAMGMPFLPQGSPDSAKIDSTTWGGRIFWIDLVTKQIGYSQITHAATPWFQDAATWFDAQTGKILITGMPASASGWLTAWLYDPATEALQTIYPTAGHNSAFVRGQGADMVYVASQDLYYIVQGRTGEVWTLKLDRVNPATASVVTKLVVTGAPLQNYANVPGSLGRPPCAFGYDPSHNVIAGYIAGGIINVFDVATRAWSNKQMLMEGGGNFTGTLAVSCLDFDDVNGVFVFNNSAPPEGNSHTFAYRFG